MALASLHASPLFKQKFSTRFSRALPVKVLSQSEEASSTSGAEKYSSGNGQSVQSVKKTVLRRKTSDVTSDTPLTTKLVESDKVAVEGVAKVDKTTTNGNSLTRVLLLAAGDAASLLLFTYIGRASHVSSAVDLDLLLSAAPFLAGWLLAASLLGDYSAEQDPPEGAKAAAASAVKTWALGVPLGIALRSAVKMQPPQLPFIAVSLLSTAVLTLGWRAASASLLPRASASRSSRRGNVLEFFELLTSLVRRW